MKSLGLTDWVRSTVLAVVAIGVGYAPELNAAPPVPGQGIKLTEVGDDFEDPEWSWTPNLPKSSKNIDSQIRQPLGRSNNNRFYESSLRGQPDVVKRVETPPGGIEGSTGALLLQTTRSGTPNSVSNQHQQDDLIVNCVSRLKGSMSVSRSPSIVVRVYVPPFDEFEQYASASFGFRGDARGRKPGGREVESYWPGFFIQYFPANAKRETPASAALLIRGRESGNDVKVRDITGPGWWTLGLSCSPDGMFHFFAREGVEDLRVEDRVASHYPYGFRCERFQSFFFNISNLDNGRNVSTGWIIDDPAMYLAR
ncbi:MAG: hypothetical protein JSS27_21365 [Planctomycetes bacterium]|nr:hypothetical protein [Planctomycetota bacterium]